MDPGSRIWNLGPGIQYEISGIWNPESGIFDPEFGIWYLGSGIQDMESGISGIRDPESGVLYLGSRIQSMESGNWNPVLDICYQGSRILKLESGAVIQNLKSRIWDLVSVICLQDTDSTISVSESRMKYTEFLEPRFGIKDLEYVIPVQGSRFWLI